MQDIIFGPLAVHVPALHAVFHTRMSDSYGVDLANREFVQLAVGGPLAGLAFGMATTFWLRFMYNTPMAEITLTIVSAYGTYIVADELMHVSAVLAVVILGKS